MEGRGEDLRELISSDSAMASAMSEPDFGPSANIEFASIRITARHAFLMFISCRTGWDRTFIFVGVFGFALHQFLVYVNLVDSDCIYRLRQLLVLFVYMVYFIDGFSYVEPSLHPWDEA
ncbi:hypothetical protein H671_8g19022 [Cricetulus griseus]|nr:hypothetical protein H671_8g19022 [Cricetulus griseus]